MVISYFGKFDIEIGFDCLMTSDYHHMKMVGRIGQEPDKSQGLITRKEFDRSVVRPKMRN